MNFSKISKNLIDELFWTNFAHFRENRNFSEKKKCFCPFFQLWVGISFQKKTDEHMMREKNDTDCRTDGRTYLQSDMHEFTGPFRPLSGLRKAFLLINFCIIPMLIK